MNHTEKLEILKTFSKLYLELNITDTSFPSVDTMIAVLKKCNFTFQSRISGSECLNTIFKYRNEIEEYLNKNDKEILKKEIQNENNVNTIVNDINIKKELPIDFTTQCDSNILEEAESRLKLCVETSFKSDNGLIMLENDLLLFQDDPPSDISIWVEEMISSWSSKLHSSVQLDFREALELWVIYKIQT